MQQHGDSFGALDDDSVRLAQQLATARHDMA
jgi:hypothetical protein